MSRLILIAVRAVRALAAEVVAAADAVASVPVAVDAVVVASVPVAADAVVTVSVPVAADAVVVVVAVVAAVVVVMALSLRRRSPPRKRPPGPHGCPPAGGHPSSTGPAPLPSSAEIGSVPHRDRSGSAPRSVQFRLEIGPPPLPDHPHDVGPPRRITGAARQHSRDPSRPGETGPADLLADVVAPAPSVGTRHQSDQPDRPGRPDRAARADRAEPTRPGRAGPSHPGRAGRAGPSHPGRAGRAGPSHPGRADQTVMTSQHHNAALGAVSSTFRTILPTPCLEARSS